MICCGNYYLCKTKHRCDDALECHALARAVVGSMDNRYRRCRVVADQGDFHYKFEMLPTYDFGVAEGVAKIKKKKVKQ